MMLYGSICVVISLFLALPLTASVLPFLPALSTVERTQDIPESRSVHLGESTTQGLKRALNTTTDLGLPPEPFTLRNAPFATKFTAYGEDTPDVALPSDYTDVAEILTSELFATIVMRSEKTAVPGNRFAWEMTRRSTRIRFEVFGYHRRPMLLRDLFASIRMAWLFGEAWRSDHYVPSFRFSTVQFDIAPDDYCTGAVYISRAPLNLASNKNDTITKPGQSNTSVVPLNPSDTEK